jgi:hypothetical protein
MAATIDVAVGRSIEIDGFAELPALVGQQDLAALRDLLEQQTANLAGACKRQHNTLLPLRWDDPIVGRLLGDRARVARLRERVVASDLRWISGYVSIKEPRTPPLWWHQDWWCWDHPVSFRAAPAQLALLIYLDDTDSCNGALRVLPGSHLRSSPIHALLPEAHGAAAAELDAAHPAFADQPGQITLSLRAGDAVVLDYRLLHGTHENASDTRRDALLLTFAPSWAELPDDVRGHLIEHPALPSDADFGRTRAAWQAELLPEWHGPRVTLTLNRNAPSRFEITR